MGIYGRDYMRAGGGARLPVVSRLSVTAWLIVVNAALWFLFAGAASWTAGRGGLYGFIDEYLLLHPEDVIARFRVWQPFTALWFHDPGGLGHIFFNMLFLYFFGRYAEGILGRSPFFRLYLAAGLTSTVVLVALAPLMGGAYRALGASGAIYGVGVFLALRAPRLEVIFFIVRMPLWVLVGVFMVGREVVNLVVLREAAAGTIAHLAGAAYGLVYERLRGHAAPTRGPGWLARFLEQRRAEQSRREERREEDVRARVDALLDKIRREGIGALSPEEKDFLERASARYGGR